MSRVVTLRADAQAEYDDGADYLAAIRPDLGEQLAKRVYASLATNPRLGREVLPGVRKKLVAETDYCIYYSFGDLEIDVISGFHTSRNPAVWQGRV